MIRPAAIFKNGMILQRNSISIIWGESDAKKIEIEFFGKKYTTNCSNNKWQIDIQTETSDNPLSMKISACSVSGECLETIVISDILLGEVWIAGGQSNMELELQNSQDGIRVVKESNYPLIRFYNVPKVSVLGKELAAAERDSVWKPAVSFLCKDVSAVAYYFARRLYEKLQVPIGIIGCYWGGTSATCWMDESSVTNIKEVNEYITGWKKEIHDKTDRDYDMQMEAYNSRFDLWNQGVCELKKRTPDISWKEIFDLMGPCPWPQPRGGKSPFRPFGLYESMVSRITPYRIKGIIYYQGEEDTDKADYYCSLNSALIKLWRHDFFINGNEKELPFYITQLPMYASGNDEDDKSWCRLRQQQELCSRVNENVHITVLIDYGELYNIHPINKKIPGQRIADTVLKKTYGMKEIADFMQLGKTLFKDNVCKLSFINSYGFLCYKRSDGFLTTAETEEIYSLSNNNSEEIYGFEVSNDDRNFYKPKISVDGENIYLIGKDNEAMTSVRYGWFNYGVANIYNGRGMPLAPFYLINNWSK